MSRMTAVLRNSIWSIEPGAVERLAALFRSCGDDEGAAPRRDRLAAVAYDGSAWNALNDSQQAQPEKVVAALPLVGVLEARIDEIWEWFGFVSMDRWVQRFNALVANERVGAIIIDIDSPGGSVLGLTEAARAVFAARGSKPIIAIANPQAASAAYYMAAAADEIVLPTSAEVGSVGTVMVHLDMSEADKMKGLKFTIIKAGKYKWEASDTEPLSEEAHQFLQKRVDDYYGLFTGDLKKFRKEAKVKAPSDFGGGRMFGAADAVEMGLADRIATLDEVASKLAEKLNKSGKRTSARAALTAI